MPRKRKPCLIEECKRAIHSNNLCRTHGRRLNEGKTLNEPIRQRRWFGKFSNPDSYFQALLNTNGNCWEWQGPIEPAGYGKMKWGNINTRAHVYAWEFFGFDRTSGLVLDHICKNKICCNPEHLQEVTIAENTLAG
mgnify:CR=1 FL=1